MENSSKNDLFKETLLSSGTNLNSTLLKTVPTTEINKIIEHGKKQDGMHEIYDKYNNLKKKIDLLFSNIE